MTVQAIIQEAIQTGILTTSQEHTLNTLLFQQDLSPSDLFLLHRLQRALESHQIEAGRKTNTVVVGRFGSTLRLVATESRLTDEAL